MSKNYENGIIGTSENGSLDLSSDIETTGVVRWVNSVSGNDSNSGQNRNAPKATLASAITASTASNGDIIILESSHTETLSSAITFIVGIKIYGLGSGSNKPSFTANAAITMFNCTDARVEFHNLRFPVGTTIGNTCRINVGGAGMKIYDCDFLCGTYDQDSILIPDGGDDAEIKGCTFTISADGPDSAVKVTSANALGVNIIDCSFDGGSYDFDDAGIYSAVAHTSYYYKDNTLLNKASIIHTAAAKGLCIGTIASDGSRVEV